MKIEGMSTEVNVSVMIDELETQRNQMRYVGAVLRLMDAVRGQAEYEQTLHDANEMLQLMVYETEDILWSAAKGQRGFHAPQAGGAA